ncbi:MAG: hypothetical protein AAF569_09485 [Pseudomonadota bacterium]
MKGNGYTNNEKTPEGRELQLQTWVAARFPMEEFVIKFMDTPHEQLEGKTPRQSANESLEGLQRARELLRALHPKKGQELKNG